VNKIARAVLVGIGATAGILLVGYLMAIISFAVAAWKTDAARPKMYTPHPGQLKVVTSIAVWADIANQIGGGKVAATAIISKANQDPHSYEATVRDQLAVNRSDVTLTNGAGYDVFFDHLVQVRANPRRYMDSVLYFSVQNCMPKASTGLNGNPHMWYEPTLVRNCIVPEISYREGLGFRAQADRQVLRNAVRAYDRKLAALVAQEDALRPLAAGKGVILTEGFAALLLHHIHLADRTPAQFKAAVSQEADASPSVMEQMRKQIQGHKVSAVITNSQTEGAQSLKIESWAKQAGIPVVKLTETLPPGRSYLSWMTSNLKQIQAAIE